MRQALAIVILVLSVCSADAGLYYSREQQAELPSQWRGFLLDHRTLRMIGAAPSQLPPTLYRQQYLEAAEKLAGLSRKRPLTAAEAADLGALYVRLGEPTRAIEVLRTGAREHPEHFAISANLGTAWQVQGDLKEAAQALREAVRLAPAKSKIFEEHQLKLVEARSRTQTRGGIDGLFGVAFVGESGEPIAGKVGPAERAKLPEGDTAIVQQLALWLPADGALLWQLGELANAHGDVRTAANILDGCVTEFGMGDTDLRRRRKLYREKADAISALPDAEHDRFRGDIKTRSTRPLAKKLDPTLLPAVVADKANWLPWLVLDETSIGRGFKPTFSTYLEKLDGKRVAMTGFMYPLTAAAGDVNSFILVEYPIGCWFCETPDPVNIVFVNLPDGASVPLKKTLVKIEGALKLNRLDPEQYLQTIQDASIGEPD